MDLRLVVALLLSVVVACYGQATPQPPSAFLPLKVMIAFFDKFGASEPFATWPGVTNLRIVNAPLPQAPTHDAPANPRADKKILVETDHNVTSLTNVIFARITRFNSPESDIYALNYTLLNFGLQFTYCSAVGFALTGEIGTMSWQCHQFTSQAEHFTTPPPVIREVSAAIHPVVGRHVTPNDVPAAYRRHSTEGHDHVEATAKF